MVGETYAVIGAVLLPGFPHLRARNQAPSWKDLAEASREVGRRIRGLQPDAFLWVSTQWFTVLGHQFQCDPNPQGRYVDENWYDFEYGVFEFDVETDVQLVNRWADEADTAGFQARRTNYPGFPIDTGTLTARELLDPDGEIPLAMMSCNLYAASDDLVGLGDVGRRAAESLSRRVVVVGVSALSCGYINRWIGPGEDRFANTEHDSWNKRILGLLEAGDIEEVDRIHEQYVEAAEVDSQFRIFPFLRGAVRALGPATLHSYGPVWGAGAAVVTWKL